MESNEWRILERLYGIFGEQIRSKIGDDYLPIESSWEDMRRIIQMEIGKEYGEVYMCGFYVSRSGINELEFMGPHCSGNIPREITEFKDIRLINIEGQPDMHLDAAILSYMHNLRHLYIVNSNLTGSFPQDIGNLKNLERMEIVSSGFAGMLPESMGELSKLHTLILEHNSISGTIPESLGNLQYLKTIVLAKNLICGSIPAEMGKLKNLRTLDLNDNRIGGSVPYDLASCESMMYFHAANNGISGAFPLKILSLPNITSIDLRNNMLSGFDDYARKITPSVSLSYMNLSDNQISSVFPVDVSGFGNLLLNLSNNQIEEIGDDVLEIAGFRFDGNPIKVMGGKFSKSPYAKSLRRWPG